jgi:hypothetical protein
MNDYYVYVYKTLAGEIFYVGQGRGRRCYDLTGKRSFELKEKLKAGAEVSFIKTGLTQKEAWALEIATIRLYRGCRLPLLNKSSGGASGNYGVVASKETRRKMSLVRKGRPSHKKGKKVSYDTIIKLRAARKRMAPPCRKQVIDIVNGYVLDSAVEAAQAYSIKESALYKQLTNKQKNKTNLRYVKDFPCL